jgi:hypothetical protein
MVSRMNPTIFSKESGFQLLTATALAVLVIFSQRSSAAQDLKITTQYTVVEGEFGDSGWESSEGALNVKGSGPGLAVLSTKSLLSYDAGLLQTIANFTGQGLPVGALSLFTRADFEINLSITGGGAIQSDYEAGKAACFGLFGSIVQMINSLQPGPQTWSWRDRWRELTGSAITPPQYHVPSR